MKQCPFTPQLLRNLAQAVTPFHAVELMAKLLSKNNFKQLKETLPWECTSPGSYFLVHNDSSLVAFTLGADTTPADGFRMVGAHTDSPSLKVKPNPVRCTQSYLQLGVEIYGGALLAPWFDRDLSLAGRVVWKDESAIHSTLIDFVRPVALIPSLAIHLDRTANKNRSIDKHKDIVPILLQVENDKKYTFDELLAEQISRQYPDASVSSILDHDILFYDTQPAAIVGFNNEFLTGARLDNLVSCFCALHALIDAKPSTNCMLVFNDHEEVGSVSTAGAQGPLLRMIFERLNPQPENRHLCINRSFLISSDNAHGIHPNALEKFDKNQSPLLNHGLVIKSNANQRYATNSITSAFFRSLCAKASIPVQNFTMRSDMTCGSTIGPLIAGEIGVKTVDIGIPTFGMHSIRETAGSKDCDFLYRAFKKFFLLHAQSSELNLLSQ